MKDISELPNDLNQKVILITGGTNGLGLTSAVESLKRNATIVITARNEQRAKEAMENIRKSAGVTDSSKLDYVIMDQSNLDSVEQGCKDFLAKNLPLHVLMCNAGIAFVPDDPIQGVEAHLFVNVLSHYLVIKRLLPYMQQQAFNSRIILLSSDAYKEFMNKKTIVEWPTLFNLDTTSSSLKDASMMTYLKKGSEAYGTSKLGDLLLARILARDLGEDSNVYVNSCHPGAVDTGMAKKTRYAGTWLETLSKGAMKIFGTNPTQGALTQLYLAWSPEVESLPLRGKYLVPIAKVVAFTPPFATDIELGQKLVETLDATLVRLGHA